MHPATAASKRQHMRDSVKERAFHEVYHNTPKAVKHTAKKFGKARAEKQRVAIALNKARRGKV